YVDGTVGDVGHGVLRDRRVLADEGFVVVVVTVDAQSCEVLAAPEIITRGWVHGAEAEAMLDEAKEQVVTALKEVAAEGTVDMDLLKRRVRQTVGRFVGERTRRRPMIVPVII